MTSVVYVDVLIALNLMINFLLLSAAARLTGTAAKPLRLLLGASVGAVGSLTIFLPFLGPVMSGVIKFTLCLVMVAAAFSYRGAWSFMKQAFAVFLVSFIFAGFMLGIYIWLGPGNMVFYNGVVYFGIQPVALLVLTGISYLIVEIIGRLTRRRQAPGEVLRLRVTHGGASVGLHVLMDTGNCLSEPFSGAPVLVCSQRDIGRIAPDYIGDYLAGKSDGKTRPGLRMIPYRTVRGKGVLPAFKPDRVHLCTGGQTRPLGALYIAVSLDPVGDERYRAIANPAILGYQYESVGEYV